MERPLAFVLNTGQIPAAALAVSLAAGSVAPPVAAVVALYVVCVAYIASTTPLTVSPMRTGGRLVYSWWHSPRGFALAMLYLVAMAICTWEYPDPLRTAMYAGQFGTLAMAAASPSAQMPEVASVWCWAAAVGGPLSSWRRSTGGVSSRPSSGHEKCFRFSADLPFFGWRVANTYVQFALSLGH